MEQENRELEEITIKDIARMCGVGVSTVSRAINNHPDINPETKQKVMDIIQKYGYIPNNSARYLKRTDGKCIAVLVKGLTNPFFAGAIKVMEDEIKKKKYSMVSEGRIWLCRHGCDDGRPGACHHSDHCILSGMPEVHHRGCCSWCCKRMSCVPE